MTGGVESTRSHRTRSAIVQAFGALARDGRFNDIRIADIIDRAGVGRSTFYEHFRNRDDVLRRSLLDSHIASMLAAPFSDGADVETTRWLLEHVRENRRMAKAILHGPSRAAVAEVVAERIDEMLGGSEGDGERRNEPSALPRRLVARLLAELQVAMLGTWLEQAAPGDAGAMAVAVNDVCRQAAAALTPTERS